MACYDAERGVIFVRPHLNSAVERCVIAHELVHFEHQDRGTKKSQEDRADRIAAQRLIRRSRVEEVTELTDDYGRIALELNVTERITGLYLRSHGL